MTNIDGEEPLNRFNYSTAIVINPNVSWTRRKRQPQVRVFVREIMRGIDGNEIGLRQSIQFAEIALHQFEIESAFAQQFGCDVIRPPKLSSDLMCDFAEGVVPDVMRLWYCAQISIRAGTRMCSKLDNYLRIHRTRYCVEASVFMNKFRALRPIKILIPLTEH